VVATAGRVTGLYRRPVARYPLPGDNVFPEGITEGGGTTFHVGSMGDGAIFRGDTATGVVEPFVPPDGDGRITITGLAVDGYGHLIALRFRRWPAVRLQPGHRGAGGSPGAAGRRGLAQRRRRGRSQRLCDRHPASAGVAPAAGPPRCGEPELAIDLTPFGPADPAYLNGIVAHPQQALLLVASQGEGDAL
jgi:hypothetical protein